MLLRDVKINDLCVIIKNILILTHINVILNDLDLYINFLILYYIHPCKKIIYYQLITINNLHDFYQIFV